MPARYGNLSASLNLRKVEGADNVLSNPGSRQRTGLPWLKKAARAFPIDLVDAKFAGLASAQFANGAVRVDKANASR